MRLSNRKFSRFSCSVVLLAGTAGVISAPSIALASAANQPATDQEEHQLGLLRDFIHFVKIARYDIAADLGRQLLDEALTPEAFVDLVEGSREHDRFEDAVAAAMRVPILEPVAAEMDSMFRDGKLARARNPQEIARNIELLTGGLRARQLGRQRLMVAGEYAMPQLLDAFLQQRDIALKAQVQRLLIDMGRQSIIPLTTALDGLDGVRQEALVEVLGLIPYRTSLPALVDLHNRTDNSAVRQACGRAIARLGGDPSKDTAEMYTALANAYYSEPAELTSFASEEYQLLWNFDRGLGLVMTPILTPVFHEAMAMRTAERSLSLDPTNAETLGLWVASNYSRALDTPDGYENPVYSSDRRGAAYYGIASGPDIAQLVLRRALDSRDTPLARNAIDAIAETAGSRMLWGQAIDENRFPLLESLSYPNRRVQYEAALALAKAQPTESFKGSERVIPLLASAVRDASAIHAIVLTGNDRERYEQYRGLLEAQGFTVLPPSDNGFDGISAAIADTPAIDLIVTAMNYDNTLLNIEIARNDPKLAVSPVFALLGPDEVEPLRRQYRRDQTIAIRRDAIGSDAFQVTVDDLLMAASGGVISLEEADAYASRAIGVLRDLAVSNNQVLNVSDAATMLIDVLEDVDGLTMLDIAEILSYVPQGRAQSAIMDRALELDGFDQQEMLSIVADSGKRFGNSLDRRQIRRLIELAQAHDEGTATAAVAAMGALEVQNTDLVPLILNHGTNNDADIIVTGK